MSGDLTTAFARLSLAPSALLPAPIYGIISSALPSNRDRVVFLLRTCKSIAEKFPAIVTSIECKALSDLVSSLAVKSTDDQWKAFLNRLKPERDLNTELHLTLNLPQERALKRVGEIQARFAKVTKIELPRVTLSLQALSSITSLALELRRLTCVAFASDVTPQAFQQVAFPKTFEWLNLVDARQRETFDEKVVKEAPQLSIDDHALLLTIVAFDRMKTQSAQAQQLAEKAVSLMPHNVRALFLLTHFSACPVGPLERVRQICPEYTPALERLALLYYQEENSVKKGHTILSELSKQPICKLYFLIPHIKGLLGLELGQDKAKGPKNPKLAKEILEAAVRYSKFPSKFKAYLGDLLRRGDQGVKKNPPRAKVLLEEAVEAERMNMDGEQFILCRRSLASLLQRGDTGVPPEPWRVEMLLAPCSI